MLKLSWKMGHKKYAVSILGQDKRYMVKYRHSPEGVPKGDGQPMPMNTNSTLNKSKGLSFFLKYLLTLRSKVICLKNALNSGL